MDLLQNVETEVSDFLEAQRPVWPNEPTACPVFACGGHQYTSYSSFYRHWGLKHEETITRYTCGKCDKDFYRLYSYTSHQRKVHSSPEPFKDGVGVKNTLFIQPGGVLPYKADLREKAAAKRRLATTPGDVLFGGEQTTCRDEEFNPETGENVFKKSKK